MQVPASARVGDHIVAYINNVRDDIFECRVTTGDTGQGSAMRAATDATHVINTIASVGAPTTVANLNLQAAMGVSFDTAPDTSTASIAGDDPTNATLLARVRLFARYWRRSVAACRQRAWQHWYASPSKLTKRELVMAMFAAHNEVAGVRVIDDDV